MDLDRPPNAVTVHEPHGFIALVNQAGNDLGVVNAARVSFDKKSEWKNSQATIGWNAERGALNDADKGLIGFLMKGHHGTPFEQNYFQFHVRAPIFVFREWHRHRIGISINEESGRYVELKGDFYLPDDEHVRIQTGKPGHYIYGPTHDKLKDDWVRARLRKAYAKAYKAYQDLLEEGIAKEIARACLPVATYSQMLWTCNARSLMAFLALRNHDKALREIKDYAAVMEDIFAGIMPVTHAAFIENGRVAP